MFFALTLALAVLLFGCVSQAAPTATPTATPTPAPTLASVTPVPTATPEPTPIGQIQQTATPTAIALSFDLEALKTRVEASVEKLLPQLKPFSMDQHEDRAYGLFYEKEVKTKENDMDVSYLFRVRRPVAEEIRPGTSSTYPKTKTIGGKTVFYDVLGDGTPAQVSKGSVSCIAEGINKALVFFEIRNKVMNIDDALNELVKVC